MSLTSNTTTETEAIDAVMKTYFKGAISGRVDDLRPAFHEGATIYGYVGPDLFGGPIDMFYQWHASNGAAADLQPRIVAVDVEGSIATARVELDNWTGHRFTDMFTLVRFDGEWKIVSKVFHLHV